jgi:hypothetical protein
MFSFLLRLKIMYVQIVKCLFSSILGILYRVYLKYVC